MTTNQTIAAARTYITSLLVQSAKDGTLGQTGAFINATIAAYHAAEVFDGNEMNAWFNAWRRTVANGTVDTVSCYDCGATIPSELATRKDEVMDTTRGDGDLCLCAGCIGNE